MADCITMIKYQGLGNDYLVLDPNKNRIQLQGKKIALLCQRGFGLGADGVLYGPDPNISFCGSPYDEDSFGCYAPALIKALDRAAGKRFSFINETGTPMEVLLEKYIDRGMPVIFWACIDMKKEIPGPEWKLLDSGETFTWISNEHCMLLTGYDEEGYWFHDPHGNNGVIRYPKEQVKKRHEAQYAMAIGVDTKF